MSKGADFNARAWRVFEAVKDRLSELPEVTRHRDMASLSYGYSTVCFGSGLIRARREGEGERGECPICISYDDPAWIEKCVDILSAGRTIECGKGVGLRQISQHVHFQTADYPLHHLAQVVRGEDPWDLDPDYQRDHVWTQKQREQFMGHLLENGRMPLIFLQDSGYGMDYQVIDGKQRLVSCLMFTDGQICAELSDGRQIWWRDFNEVDRRCSPHIKCGIVRLESRAEVLRFYLKLNRGGTVHSDAEIDRVKHLLVLEEAKEQNL